MLGQVEETPFQNQNRSLSPPKEKRSLPLQVEADQAASPEDVASRQSSRFLWTGLGLAVLTLIGVLACALHPFAPHAPVKPPSLLPEVAFSPMPAIAPRGIRPGTPPVSKLRGGGRHSVASPAMRLPGFHGFPKFAHRSSARLVQTRFVAQDEHGHGILPLRAGAGTLEAVPPREALEKAWKITGSLPVEPSEEKKYLGESWTHSLSPELPEDTSTLPITEEEGKYQITQWFLSLAKYLSGGPKEDIPLGEKWPKPVTGEPSDDADTLPAVQERSQIAQWFSHVGGFRIKLLDSGYIQVEDEVAPGEAAKNSVEIISGDIVPPGEASKKQQRGFWGWFPWKSQHGTRGDSVMPGGGSRFEDIVPPGGAEHHSVGSIPADIVPPGEAAKGLEQRGFWGWVRGTPGDSLAFEDASEVEDVVAPAEAAKNSMDILEQPGFWGWFPWKSEHASRADSMMPGEMAKDSAESIIGDSPAPGEKSQLGILVPSGSEDRIPGHSAEAAKDLETGGAWKWISWKSIQKTPGDKKLIGREETQLDDILDPGEIGTLPDISGIATSEQILEALSAKQTRLAKHIKYSAAAQFAYQNYMRPDGTSDRADSDGVNALDLNSPKALSDATPGADITSLVESFELHQVTSLPDFPELAEHVSHAVNSKLKGSQIKVNIEGSLIDESTGFNMMLLVDKENKRELIMVFGGTSGGANSMSNFSEKILQAQWKSNIFQGCGGIPASTLQAVTAAEAVTELLQLRELDMDIVTTGHSKGGMEAIVAGLSLGIPTYADNPAPVVGARSLIEATASARGVKEGKDILQHSKRYVHTTSISLDPVSHLMGPTRQEFGIHDHIQCTSTHPLGAHVNVWESLSMWLTHHPPVQIERIGKRIKKKYSKAESVVPIGLGEDGRGGAIVSASKREVQQLLQQEEQLDQEVQTVIEALNIDVPDALQREEKRDIFIKAFNYMTDQTGASWHSLSGLTVEQVKALGKLLDYWREDHTGEEVKADVEALHVEVPDASRRDDKGDIFIEALSKVSQQTGETWHALEHMTGEQVHALGTLLESWTEDSEGDTLMVKLWDLAQRKAGWKGTKTTMREHSDSDRTDQGESHSKTSEWIATRTLVKGQGDSVSTDQGESHGQVYDWGAEIPVRDQGEGASSDQGERHSKTADWIATRTLVKGQGDSASTDQGESHGLVYDWGAEIPVRAQGESASSDQGERHSKTADWISTRTLVKGQGDSASTDQGESHGRVYDWSAEIPMRDQGESASSDQGERHSKTADWIATRTLIRDQGESERSVSGESPSNVWDSIASKIIVGRYKGESDSPDPGESHSKSWDETESDRDADSRPKATRKRQIVHV